MSRAPEMVASRGHPRSAHPKAFGLWSPGCQEEDGKKEWRNRLRRTERQRGGISMSLRCWCAALLTALACGAHAPAQPPPQVAPNTQDAPTPTTDQPVKTGELEAPDASESETKVEKPTGPVDSCVTTECHTKEMAGRVLHGPITAACPASFLRTHADAMLTVADYVAEPPDIQLR